MGWHSLDKTRRLSKSRKKNDLECKFRRQHYSYMYHSDPWWNEFVSSCSLKTFDRGTELTWIFESLVKKQTNKKQKNKQKKPKTYLLLTITECCQLATYAQSEQIHKDQKVSRLSAESGSSEEHFNCKPLDLISGGAFTHLSPSSPKPVGLPWLQRRKKLLQSD